MKAVREKENLRVRKKALDLRRERNIQTHRLVRYVHIASPLSGLPFCLCTLIAYGPLSDSSGFIHSVCIYGKKFM